jgi:uncharacterized membrane-anchored protein YitT (DUF2179 family)
MAKKLSISQKLAKRKYKPASKFIYWIYKFVMVDIVGRKYKPKFHIIDKVTDCDGPCFVVFNHLSRIDHMYVMGATYPRVTNMIAGNSEFYRTKFSFIFGLNKSIYGIIIVVINSILVDKIMLGISNSKVFYISTKKPDEIKGLIKTMKTGYTLLKAEGGYSKQKQDMIMCVINNKDYYMFKNIVEQIDPESFIIITDCYEVYGGKRKETFPFI